MPSAFVLGGSGQIGRAVVRRLAEAGWEVTAASRGQREAPAGARHVQVDRVEDGGSPQRSAAAPTCSST